MKQYATQGKGGEFQELVWETLRTLREKSSKEYRKPELKVIHHGNWSEKVKETDSRIEFIQVVEFLSDILVQEFEGKHKDYKEEYDEILNSLEEQKQKVIDEDTKNDYTKFKLEKMREMLRLCMKFIKKEKYLKGMGVQRSREKQYE